MIYSNGKYIWNHYFKFKHNALALMAKFSKLIFHVNNHIYKSYIVLSYDARLNRNFTWMNRENSSWWNTNVSNVLCETQNALCSTSPIDGWINFRECPLSAVLDAVRSPEICSSRNSRENQRDWNKEAQRGL